MKTPLFLTTNPTSNVSASAARNLPFAGGGSAIASVGTGTTFTVAQQAPYSGTVSSLHVKFNAYSGSETGTYQVTLYKGASPTTMVATALSVTVTKDTLTPSDVVNVVSVAAGEYLGWKVEPTNTPGAQTSSVQIAALFEATVVGQSAFFTFVPTGAAQAFFMPIGTGGGFNQSSEAAATATFPIPGSMTKLYVAISAAPGAGNSRTVTLRRNGADTGLTVTFGATDTEKVIDLSGSPVAFAAGDTGVLSHTIVGTPPNATVRCSLGFIPTTSGLALRFGSANTGFPATGISFYGVAATTANSQTTEANTPQIVPAALTVKSSRVDFSPAAGTGKSRAFALRKNGADTAASFTVADAAVTGSSANEVTYARGDLIGYGVTATNTPAIATYGMLATVMTVTGGGAGVNFAPNDRDGMTFDGVRNAGANSRVQVGGAYSGAPTNVEVALYDAPSGGSLVAAWASASTQAAGAYAHTFTGLPIGGPYYHAVRDNGGAVTRSSAGLYVGAVVVLWGQSQCQKLHTDDLTGLVPPDGMQVRILAYTSQTDVTTATTTLTRFTSQTTGLALRTGSGVVAMAKQWHEDTGGTIPLMLVTNAYQGTSIRFWVNDEKGTDAARDGSGTTDVTTLWGTSPTTGFTWHMAAAAKYQATAVVFMQGTADVGKTANVGNTGKTYAQYMDDLKAKFEALYTRTVALPLFLVVPHQRSDDGDQTFVMRQVQYDKAISGGTWRLCCMLLDWQMDTNGSPHQAVGATGNIRGGTRIGRGLAANLVNSALLTARPQIASAVRAANGAYVDVTFDRDIETPAGVSTGLPGWWWSANGTSWPALANFSGAITGPRTLRLTSTGGAVPAGAKIDTLRGIPFASDSTGSDYVGPEANTEANYLSKVIVDTSAFDGGRGAPLMPVMGAGYSTTEQTVTYTTIAKGTFVTLTKAQLATLRVKDGARTSGTTGAEPFSLRWERKSGDLTGKPIDGINVPLTVA